MSTIGRKYFRRNYDVYCYQLTGYHICPPGYVFVTAIGSYRFESNLTESGFYAGIAFLDLNFG